MPLSVAEKDWFGRGGSTNKADLWEKALKKARGVENLSILFVVALT